MTPTYVSLFAGVGGFDLGMDTAGYRCVAQVEWDKHCRSVLAHHWPDIPRWGDIQTVSGHDLPRADVITFGSPCQDLSVAGKRAGLDGGRSSMFHEAVRIIREMQDGSDGAFPRAAIWENVPGALSSNGGADFGVVLDEMAELGALVIEWAVLDARYFGIPQRRRRVFLAAIFDPAAAERCPDPLFPVATSTTRDRETRWFQTTADTPAVGAMDRVIAFDSTFGGQAQFLADISPPVKVGSSVGIASPPAICRDGEPPRKLTPLECERLQGWPDNHTLRKSTGAQQHDAHRYKQCGNGVASPVAAWVGRQLLPLLT